MKEVDLWTDVLMNVGDITIGTGIEFKEYAIEQGTAMSWTLYKDPSNLVHVMRAFLSAGTVFPLHKHDISVESLIMYEGNVDLLCEDHDCVPGMTSMEIRKPYMIEAGKKHKLIAHEDSRIIAVLIPPDQNLLGEK